MGFRIGVNLGDVISERERLLRDWRERCCSVGTTGRAWKVFCIYKTVYDQVRKIVVENPLSKTLANAV